jgi:hypothetical protein
VVIGPVHAVAPNVVISVGAVMRGVLCSGVTREDRGFGERYAHWHAPLDEGLTDGPVVEPIDGSAATSLAPSTPQFTFERKIRPTRRIVAMIVDLFLH